MRDDVIVLSAQGDLVTIPPKLKTLKTLRDPRYFESIVEDFPPIYGINSPSK
jgi:hypothetical protein